MNTSDSTWPCAIHNPDNLTPEQFGDLTIWRPATPDETLNDHHQFWLASRQIWLSAARKIKPCREYPRGTYRIRLAARPWPVAKAAEFPPPPVGHEWHNPRGITPDELPKDRRLLVKQEASGAVSLDAAVCYSHGKNLVSPEARFYHPLYTYSVPASTPFPPADLTDADPCPTSPPCGWVEVKEGVRQRHDWMGQYSHPACWCITDGFTVQDWHAHGEGFKIYRHPARMPKAEEKAEAADAPNNPQNVDPRHIPAGYRFARTMEMGGKWNDSARAWSVTGERFVPTPGCHMDPSKTIVDPVTSADWQASAEKVEPELPGVEHHMRNSEPFDLQSRAEKAEAILAECMAIMPHGHTPSHTLENLPGRIGDLAGQLAEECSEREKAEAALDASRADWHRLNALLCESNDRVGKLESELAALKSRKIGVLLPIVEPLPPVPEGCERRFAMLEGKQLILGCTRLDQDVFYMDIAVPAAPDKRAEFEALWRSKFAGDYWQRGESGVFTHGLIEGAFQHWLNAGGDK